MNKPWPRVRLGEVLARSAETVTISPESEYREITARLWGKGIVLRGTVSGAEIAGTRRFVAKSGQLILSRIDARNGAIGVVPEELDGAVVTNDFPLFNITRNRVDAAFLGWMSKTNPFVELCKRASEGTTNRVRLQEERFLALEVSLPPLPEQRRIVARIEALSAKVEEARRLRNQVVETSEVFPARVASEILDGPKWECERLETVLAEPPRSGLSPQPETESDGQRMLRINAVSSAPTRFVDPTAFKRVDVSDEVAAPFVLRQDDVLIVRYNGDLNRVAKAAIFKDHLGLRIIYPDKLMRLRPRPDKMLPDFLVFALSSRRVRGQIEELGKTTAGQIGVSGADAKAFVVPVPPVDEQRRIVAYLDDLQNQVDTLTQLQSQTAAKLDALLPSILDRAFNGLL